jgi:hypothetical protein
VAEAVPPFLSPPAPIQSAPRIGCDGHVDPRRHPRVDLLAVRADNPHVFGRRLSSTNETGSIQGSVIDSCPKISLMMLGFARTLEENTHENNYCYKIKNHVGDDTAGNPFAWGGRLHRADCLPNAGTDKTGEDTEDRNEEALEFELHYAPHGQSWLPPLIT